MCLYLFVSNSDITLDEQSVFIDICPTVYHFHLYSTEGPKLIKSWKKECSKQASLKTFFDFFVFIFDWLYFFPFSFSFKTDIFFFNFVSASLRYFFSENYYFRSPTQNVIHFEEGHYGRLCRQIEMEPKFFLRGKIPFYISQFCSKNMIGIQTIKSNFIARNNFRN